GSSGPLNQYSFNPATEQFTLAQQSVATYSFPGATAAVSASGTTNGIVWAMNNGSYCTPASCGPTILHAYDATNVSVELWNSTQDNTDVGCIIRMEDCGSA